MAEWIAAEIIRAELSHTVECQNVTGRTKDGIDQSKRVRVHSLKIVD